LGGREKANVGSQKKKSQQKKNLDIKKTALGGSEEANAVFLIAKDFGLCNT
jgi:hypothetical protein